MAGKAGKGRSSGKPKETTAVDHRKMANTLQAKARLHSAKADLMDAKNPPKKPSRGCIY